MKIPDIEFESFGKIARLSREIIVTEKIDGSNATVFIDKELNVFAASRGRWITPENDNFGFAAWVEGHREELSQMGPGMMRGEWFGSGINRGYGLPKGLRRFAMFNTIRWCECDEEPRRIETGDPRIEKYQERLPACCELVPVLWKGLFDTDSIHYALHELEANGSHAAPGYLFPEGVVIHHIAANVSFKKTLGKDGHKGV